MTEELHSHPPVHPRLDKIERDVHFIRSQIELVIRALGAEQLRAPGMPDGILQTLEKCTAAIKEHDERIKMLESKRDAIKLVALNVLTAVLGGALTGWVTMHLGPSK